MRCLLQEWLTEAGYHVRLAGQHDRQSDSPADLVVASVYMPKQAGMQYVRAIRSAHPDTPIIAISGQFRAGLSRAGATARALGVERVIAKPLVRSDLLDSVRAIIGTSG